jgi:hypothetical protein
MKKEWIEARKGKSFMNPIERQNFVNQFQLLYEDIVIAQEAEKFIISR